VLTESINWHWIFFINLPIGVITAVLVTRLLPRDAGAGFGEGTDILGAVLITSALMLGVYTMVKPAAELGWSAGRTLTLGGIALALLAGFIARQAAAKNPLMPLRVFRSRNVTGANLIQILSVAGMFGVFFLGSLYLQRVLGYNPLQIGLAFLPVTILMGVLSLRYAEGLIMRFGARATLVPGLVLILAGLVMFSRAPVDGHYVADVLPVMALLGTGAGLCFPALMTLAMSGARADDAGLASGLVNTTAQVGGALGLALLATLSSARSGKLEASGRSSLAAMTGGYHLAFWIGAALVALAIVVALTVLRVPAVQAAPAQESAEDRELVEAAA
jgi:MFS family permease